MLFDRAIVPSRARCLTDIFPESRRGASAVATSWKTSSSSRPAHTTSSLPCRRLRADATGRTQGHRYRRSWRWMPEKDRTAPAPRPRHRLSRLIGPDIELADMRVDDFPSGEFDIYGFCRHCMNLQNECGQELNENRLPGKRFFSPLSASQLRGPIKEAEYAWSRIGVLK